MKRNYKEVNEIHIHNKVSPLWLAYWNFLEDCQEELMFIYYDKHGVLGDY
jgi:uncharacterized secreted protein with C-terminal beta-propeller domain